MQSSSFDDQEATEMDSVAKIDAELERLLRERNRQRPEEEMVLRYKDGELWQPFKPLTSI